MKHELIKTEDYLFVVSDKVIDDVRPYAGKYHLEKGYLLNRFPTYLADLTECKLIIAHLPLNGEQFLEGVDVLPELIDQQAEKLANDYANTFYPDETAADVDFLEGYKKAKETYKYTEKDLRRAIGCGIGLELWKEEEQINNFIQSLNQSKLPIAFECEPRYLDIDEIRERGKGFLNGNSIVPKTITNSEGRTEWVGKYLF